MTEPVSGAAEEELPGGGATSGPDDLCAARPQAKPGVEAHGVMEEMVLYDPERDMAFSLNLSARAVWELCDGEHTVAEIADELRGALQDVPSSFAADVTRSVRRFHELELVTLGGLPGTASPDAS